MLNIGTTMSNVSIGSVVDLSENKVWFRTDQDQNLGPKRTRTEENFKTWDRTGIKKNFETWDRTGPGPRKIS